VTQNVTKIRKSNEGISNAMLFDRPR